MGRSRRIPRIFYPKMEGFTIAAEPQYRRTRSCNSQASSSSSSRLSICRTPNVLASAEPDNVVSNILGSYNASFPV